MSLFFPGKDARCWPGLTASQDQQSTRQPFMLRRMGGVFELYGD